MSETRAISTTSRRGLSPGFNFSLFFFLQGKAPKETHAILTETLACFLPGRAKDLSARRYSLHLTQNTPNFFYFDACTVNLVQFIIRNNKCTIYIYIYIYKLTTLFIVSTPTCFDASASSPGSLILLLC